jgi:hypothetical protein
MPERKSDMSVEYDRKKCKAVTSDTKPDVIKRFVNGQSKASMSRAQGISESSVLIPAQSN